MRVLAALLWGSVTLLAPPGAGLGDRGESRAALHGLARLAGLGVGGAPARAQSDATAPVPVSAMANGATLVLSFDEELAAAPHLVNSAFTVKRTVG